MMRLWTEEDGQALVVVALSVSLLLGFVALAVDVGMLFRAKRNVQIAADAAAVAAALDFKYNQSVPSAMIAANAATRMNGYANGSNGVRVILSTPPADGSNTVCQTCAEVQVSVPNPTTFMSMFGFGSINVAARAVAGPVRAENSVYLLGGSDPAFNNSGSITLVNGGLIDNSGTADAFTNAGTVSATLVGVVGGASGGGTSTPAPVLGILPSGDPLNRTAPQIPAVCAAALTAGSANPGCYNGISIAGGATVTLTPGLYVINGPFSLGALSTLTGTGVTIYLNNTTTNPITIDPTATMTLSAPTSGTWNGILFFGSSTGTFALTGTAGSNLQGIIYLPSATLDLSGASSMQLFTPLVVNQLTNTGPDTITLRDYLTQNTFSPLRTITLLE
jgi:hypothetical protein